MLSLHQHPSVDIPFSSLEHQFHRSVRFASLLCHWIPTSSFHHQDEPGTSV